MRRQDGICVVNAKEMRGIKFEGIIVPEVNIPFEIIKVKEGRNSNGKYILKDLFSTNILISFGDTALFDWSSLFKFASVVSTWVKGLVVSIWRSLVIALSFILPNNFIFDVIPNTISNMINRINRIKYIQNAILDWMFSTSPPHLVGKLSTWSISILSFDKGYSSI